MDCEKWRREFGGGIDHLLQTFDFTEDKKKLAHIYPQYYHGTDRVSKVATRTLRSY